MSTSVGKLMVSDSSQDRISIIWTRGFTGDFGTKVAISPTFVLETHEGSVAFWLQCELTRKTIFNVVLHNNSDDQIRAIACIKIKTDRGKSDVLGMKILVNDSWKGPWMLKNVGTLHDFYELYLNLSIECTIIWCGFTDNIARQFILSNPMGDLLNPKYKSDIEIIAEGKIIVAHRIILAAHSPVISAMLEKPMKEWKDNCIEIKDIDYCTMNALIQIIYSGKADDLKDVELILKVLRAAETYEMRTVKNICEHHLRINLNDNNALMILENACHVIGLCDTIVRYLIASNKEVISLHDLKKFCLPRPHLSSILITILMDFVR